MDFAELLKTFGARNQRGGKPRDWFSMKNLAAGEAEIFIYDVIGESWYGGVTAGQFVSELRALTANKILLRINSPGGDIFDAITIRNALLEHPAEVESHIDGIAASCASWVALQDKVIMSPHATMMIHEPYNVVYGDAAQMRKQAEILDKFGNEIADMYVEKAGGTRDEWRGVMRAETWYTDEEAVAAGLADEIAGDASKAENRYDASILSIFKNTPEHLADNKPRRAAPPRKTNVAQRPADELVHATLLYQRDESRRLGVAV